MNKKTKKIERITLSNYKTYKKNGRDHYIDEHGIHYYKPLYISKKESFILLKTDVIIIHTRDLNYTAGEVIQLMDEREYYHYFKILATESYDNILLSDTSFDISTKKNAIERNILINNISLSQLLHYALRKQEPKCIIIAENVESTTNVDVPEWDYPRVFKIENNNSDMPI